MPFIEEKKISTGFFTHPGRAHILLAIVLCLALAACALYKVKREVQESYASTVIIGHVTASSAVQGPIVVAAYQAYGDRREIAYYTILHDAGEFELIVHEGSYYVFAYNDRNSNLILDPGEPAGQYGPPPGGGRAGRGGRLHYYRSQAPGAGTPH